MCLFQPGGGSRALIEAAKGGNLEQVNLAISDWGNVNAKGGKLMATPLHYATVHGHMAIVERLLDKGADTELTDANGETPLHDAAAFGRVEVGQTLLTHEAQVNSLTPEEQTPLDYAIDANAEEMIELLRTNGGKTGAGTVHSHRRQAGRSSEAIQQHLDAGVDVNLLDDSGATPFDYATKLETEETAKFLRKQGGKTYGRTEEWNGKSWPIDWLNLFYGTSNRQAALLLRTYSRPLASAGWFRALEPTTCARLISRQPSGLTCPSTSSPLSINATSRSPHRIIWQSPNRFSLQRTLPVASSTQRSAGSGGTSARPCVP